MLIFTDRVVAIISNMAHVSVHCSTHTSTVGYGFVHWVKLSVHFSPIVVFLDLVMTS